MPIQCTVAAAAAVVATQASVPDSATAAGAAQLLSGLGNLSLSDQASIASAAGAAGALQAAGNLANGSEADVQANVSVGASTTGADSASSSTISLTHLLGSKCCAQGMFWQVGPETEIATPSLLWRLQAQLAAINAGAASALEAALAGRPPPLGSDSTAGLLAAQQVAVLLEGVQGVLRGSSARLKCPSHKPIEPLEWSTAHQEWQLCRVFLQVLQQQQDQQAVQQVGAAGALLNGAAGTGSLTSSGDLPAASSPTAAGAAAVAAGFAGVPTAGTPHSAPHHLWYRSNAEC